MKPPGGRRAFAGLAVAAVVAVVITGLIVSGSPAEQRVRRLDERRAQDLAQIKGAVDAYWSTRNGIPESFAELTEAQGPYLRNHERDPENGVPYEYRVVGDSAYELCAEFQRATDDESPYMREWSHPAGRRCFRLVPEKTLLR
jgi:hypothetical protein